MRLAEPFTYRETGLAIGVHRRIAGLLESVYELCRSRKLGIKAVSTFLPIHAVQRRTYLRMNGIHVCPLLELQITTSDGWPLARRGLASVEADRCCSVLTVFSALTPC